MIIGSILENDTNETRTPLTPDVVQKLTSLGHTLLIEKNIGVKSFFKNKTFEQNGAIFMPPAEIYQKADLLLQISPPSSKYLSLLTSKQILVANFTNFKSKPLNITFIRLENVPRTSVAQSIDILSSQDTIKGYASAIYALSKLPTIAPLLMTSSTTLKPAKALILGASITGLQASNVLKRNGCDVTILDINKENFDLAKSVGATLKTPSNQEELQELIKDKNIIIGAINNNNSPNIISQKLSSYINEDAIIVDTSSNNISISPSSNLKFYRNTKIERLHPKSASILWANNMLNLIELITSNPKIIDLNHPILSPMTHTIKRIKKS